MLSQELFNCLSQNKFFKNVDQNDLKKLDERFFHIKQCRTGDIIVKEGTIGDEMFLIVEGTVQVSKKLSDGEEMNINQQHAGEFLGETSLISKKGRLASAYCLTPVKLIGIKKDTLFSIIDSIPRLMNNVVEIIAEWLRSSDARSISEAERSLELLILNKKISEQKKVLETQKTELEQLNATKDKFFSIIAHDLKNPLNVFLNFAGILFTDYDEFDDEQRKVFIKAIYESSNNLNKLLENLVHWSSLQIGQIECNAKDIDLYRVVNDNINLLNPNANKKRITIRTDINQNTMVYADIDMVDLIFRNLISNAIKFTGDGGMIRISAKPIENFEEITISDTGLGIPENDICKLFRLDVKHTTLGTEEERGTGLGLILCQEFVRKNRGKIWVESELEKGSNFKFTLPKP